ncbi:MAG: DUF3565 domain-containing protein [Candidatus Tectimicrobiota bacterium]
MQRKIVGYHQDALQDWVAELDCGHKQHVRHNPPWLNRPWVVEPEGRRRYLGMLLDCKRCDEEAVQDG